MLKTPDNTFSKWLDVSVPPPSENMIVWFLGFGKRDDLSYYFTVREAKVTGHINTNLIRFDGVSAEDGECGSPVVSLVNGIPAVVGVFCLAHAENEGKKRRSGSSSSSSNKRTVVTWPMVTREIEQSESAHHGTTYYHAFTSCDTVQASLSGLGVQFV